MNHYTPKVFTVSQLNSHINNLISNDPELGVIFIEGELSNLKVNARSGHMYFSLKDENSVVNAVMFKWAAQSLRFRPESGMKVILRASVTVYEPMGQYQLRVEDMQPDGVGVLAMQLEQLKKRLNAEGLFAPEHKQPIPRYPGTIGVITSPTGAALRDILNILSRRYPCAEVVLAPVLVQGDGAPEQLVRAVDAFSDSGIADVIIIGRGGGSMEDLWAFNDESLVRAIYRCRTPVISAVGHETDTTLCDFVSDLRAPTPSAAAELAVPDRDELLSSIYAAFDYASGMMHKRISAYDSDFENLHRLVLARSPMPSIDHHVELIRSLYERAANAAEYTYRYSVDSAVKLYEKLDLLNPVSVLTRGYAYLTHEDRHIRSIKELSVGDMLSVRLSDGTASAVVSEVQPEE